MAAQPTKKQVKNSIVKAMKELGVYKVQYEKLIDVYTGLMHQYLVFESQFEASGYQVEEEYTNKAGATNMRKVPLYTAMESLRKDIAMYSDRLCLNPKAIENITVEQKKQSTLEMAMMRRES